MFHEGSNLVPDRAPRRASSPLRLSARRDLWTSWSYVARPGTGRATGLRLALGRALRVRRRLRRLLATVLTLPALRSPSSVRNPFALFYAAVMLSAWYGGLGPGLLATACSRAGDRHVPRSRRSSARVPGSHEIVQVGIFGGVALLISSLNGMRKRAAPRARRR